MTEQFYKYLNLPDSCYLGKRIYKKMFYENASLNSHDKKAFSEDIEEILWVYTLKTETINIPRYEDAGREYYEIAIIQVSLKNIKRVKRLAPIIQRAIPYPLLLVFTYQHQILLNVADKRKSKADKEKITVENEQNTHWIDLNQQTANEQAFIHSCHCQNFSYNNFYQFYNDLCSRITALRCAEQSGHYQLQNNDDRRETLTKIHQLQTQQSELKSTLRKESRFSEKVSLNVQIKHLNQKIETIKQTL